MCRLLAFRSSVPSAVHQSLLSADNALARQSREHPDGWGVAYYKKYFPHLIRSDKEAHTDGLFRDLSEVVATRTLLAHVRRATVGEISVLNCHPFQHGPWTFAHNGEVAGFGDDERLREPIAAAVDPRFRRSILGNTDSEVFFFLFLSQLGRRVDDIYHAGIRPELIVESLRATVSIITDIAYPLVGEERCLLTFAITNGSNLLAYRHGKRIFYSTHKTLCPERDSCHAFEEYRCEREVHDGLIKHLLITSERHGGDVHVWQEIADGEYVVVDHGMNFHRQMLAM